MAANITKIGSTTEVDRLLKKVSATCSITDYVEVGEEKICLPERFAEYEERIRKFEVDADDIFLIAHPKTGTTWCQEMIWLIVNHPQSGHSTQEVRLRFPLLEGCAYLEPNIAEQFFGCHPWKFIHHMTKPRCIKSHLHWSLLPEQIRNGTKQPKIIGIFRNPHDTFLSYYHHCRLIEGYQGTMEEFAVLFIAGRLPFGPFWKSVLSLWEQRDRPNVLLLRYKDLKDDLPAAIRKVGNFLGKALTEERVAALTEHLSFHAMKKNPAVNQDRLVKLNANKFGMNASKTGFIRIGSEGNYKSEMPAELIEKFNKWEKDNLAGTDLKIN